MQKVLKPVFLQGLHLTAHATVIVKDMDGAQHGAVARISAQPRQLLIELVLRNVAQVFFPKKFADSFQLRRNGRVLRGQVGVVGAGVDDAQRMAAGRKVKGHRRDHRRSRVGKVNGNDAADGAGGLIHQAAGLAEVDVFRILPDLRKLHRAELPVQKQAVADRRHQHLKGSRRGKPAARQHVGLHIGVEAAGRSAQCGHPRSHAAHQCRRRARFLRPRRKAVQRHDAQGVALGLHADLPGAVGGDRRSCVKVHRAGQHEPVLMIGVVAAQLRPAGRGKEALGYSLKALREFSLDGFVHGCFTSLFYFVLYFYSR